MQHDGSAPSLSLSLSLVATLPSTHARKHRGKRENFGVFEEKKNPDAIILHIDNSLFVLLPREQGIGKAKKEMQWIRDYSFRDEFSFLDVK